MALLTPTTCCCHPQGRSPPCPAYRGVLSPVLTGVAGEGGNPSLPLSILGVCSVLISLRHAFSQEPSVASHCSG